MKNFQISLDEIQLGLTRNEFFLEYLPIVCLRTNRCIGAEALIRWQYQDKVIPPLEFITLIENTHLSGLITYWVIEELSRELKEWLKINENVQMSINVPPELFGRGGVWYAFEKSGLLELGSKIILEITERGIPDSLGIQTLNLPQSIKTGVKIAVDDLMINQSSAIVLSRTNIDIIKLDKPFMDEIERGWSSPIINTINNLIQTTNIDFVAEWVESEVQVNKLRQIGIQMGQGWYFSPPLSAKKLKSFFLESRAPRKIEKINKD